MGKKYVLNVKTKTYHIIDGCHHSRQYPKNDHNFEEYSTEDQIIKKYQHYVSKCKICFKNK